MNTHKQHRDGLSSGQEALQELLTRMAEVLAKVHTRLDAIDRALVKQRADIDHHTQTFADLLKAITLQRERSELLAEALAGKAPEPPAPPQEPTKH